MNSKKKLGCSKKESKTFRVVQVCFVLFFTEVNLFINFQLLILFDHKQKVRERRRVVSKRTKKTKKSTKEKENVHQESLKKNTV